MKTEEYIYDDLQNDFYGRYKQNEEIKNLFVFNFFGELTHATDNFPGSWHDKKVGGA